MVAFADSVQTFWNEIAARPDGPMAFRFYLQPIMASLLALRDGIKDAHTGRTPYFWTIVHDPEHRRESLKEGLTATARVLSLGVIMDIIYQFSVLGGPRPLETIFVALLLCFIPYLLLRGPFARIARAWMHRHPEGGR